MATDAMFAEPVYASISEEMRKKSMTLKYQWNRYCAWCDQSGGRACSYRPFPMPS